MTCAPVNVLPVPGGPWTTSVERSSPRTSAATSRGSMASAPGRSAGWTRPPGSSLADARRLRRAAGPRPRRSARAPSRRAPRGRSAAAPCCCSSGPSGPPGISARGWGAAWLQLDGGSAGLFVGRDEFAGRLARRRVDRALAQLVLLARVAVHVRSMPRDPWVGCIGLGRDPSAARGRPAPRCRPRPGRTRPRARAGRRTPTNRLVLAPVVGQQVREQPRRGGLDRVREQRALQRVALCASSAAASVGGFFGSSARNGNGTRTAPRPRAAGAAATRAAAGSRGVLLVVADHRACRAGSRVDQVVLEERRSTRSPCARGMRRKPVNRSSC